MANFKLAFDGGDTMTLRKVKPADPDMQGTDVKSWQQLLHAQGFSPGEIDGFWGDKSNTALLAFQKAQGLKEDGIIGASTGERLIEGYPQV